MIYSGRVKRFKRLVHTQETSGSTPVPATKVSGKYIYACAGSSCCCCCYTLNDKLVEDYSLVGLASTAM